jgi:hypothetical protein
MKAQSVFYERPIQFTLMLATRWTLIFWTLPFIYLWIKGQETLVSTGWFFIICGIITMAAAIFIYVAMWIYLFARGNGPRSSRILWGIVFFLTGWYGSCVYFWAVYRRDFLAATCAPQQPANPSQLV